MPIFRCVVGALLAGLLVPVAVRGDGPSKFVVPKTKEAWDRQKADLAEAISKIVARESSTLRGGQGKAGPARDGCEIELHRLTDDRDQVVQCL
jgi:hypothetical protein